MNRETLTSLFSAGLYQIPDYQRGYAWEEKQWKDFIQDVDALVEDSNFSISSHYTGTVVVYCRRGGVEKEYGTKRFPVKDVVDGQQRLTTSCLYLSEILRTLVAKGEAAFKDDILYFLYSGATCKLTLNNDTADIFYDLLKTGKPNIEARSPHEKRLVGACNRFHEHIQKQLELRGASGVEYLKNLFHAITQKLHFTFYTIEEECEIGMTFELMNSRGKELSVLELLKNYLMHWISRNGGEDLDRKSLTQLINKNWKDTYTNIGQCNGDEDQCLRVAWTLYCSHTPANWTGYDGFKGDDYIPLRNFQKRSKADTKAFVEKFADALAEISNLYACITSPTMANVVSSDELLWLTKIHNVGNVANFLPLMVAARRLRLGDPTLENDYINLLKALECFAYRVFLFEGRRSNAGKSSFYRWGAEIVALERSLNEVTADVHELTRYYASEESFKVWIQKPENWYSTRHLLKYSLFEYELHLLATEGKGKQPHLKWEDLSDSSIEHILPQTPVDGSQWKVDWSDGDFAECLHDIGNLVLTQNNSSYSNFDFQRKKGKTGQSPSYSNSDIRQERKISLYSTWTRKEFDLRRAELVTWIGQRWKTESIQAVVPIIVVDEADEDANLTKSGVSAL